MECDVPVYRMSGIVSYRVSGETHQDLNSFITDQNTEKGVFLVNVLHNTDTDMT